MPRSLLLIAAFAVTCFFAMPAFAQKKSYLGKQFLLGATFNGNPGWNEPKGDRFWLFACNQRGAVGLSKRLFVGLQNRVFWSKADDLPVVQTWLGGGFARYYALAPRGAKPRWAISVELGYYRGNHFMSQNPGTEGVMKKRGQSVPNFGVSVERRLVKNIWIELAHNIFMLDAYDLDSYPSIGILWHWGRSNAFAAPKADF